MLCEIIHGGDVRTEWTEEGPLHTADGVPGSAVSLEIPT